MSFDLRNGKIRLRKAWIKPQQMFDIFFLQSETQYIILTSQFMHINFFDAIEKPIRSFVNLKIITFR